MDSRGGNSSVLMVGSQALKGRVTLFPIFAGRTTMEMPHQTFRCSPIRFSVALQKFSSRRRHFRRAELLTKAIRDQQVDA
jgi:hypothetical protein